MTHLAERERKAEPGLRPIVPEEISSYLDAHFESQVRVELAPPSGMLEVPRGWHGEGKTGEAMVLFGDLLTKPIGGTQLPAEALTAWLSDMGCILQVWGKEATPAAAAFVLSGDETSYETPLFRAFRPADQKHTAVQIEYYAGALAYPVRQLTAIGNRDTTRMGWFDKEAYKGMVASLMRPFIAKGTTVAKRHLGVSPDTYKLRRLDDCLAAATTIMGDILVDKKLGRQTENLFEEIGVAVATTQGVVLMTHFAQKRGVPLLLRAGAPSFGLAGESMGLNYMANTQPELLSQGYFTSGDFGAIMGSEKDRLRPPSIVLRGDGNSRYETRFFLNGGGPILEMMELCLQERDKPVNGVVSVRRAARIDCGPREWGLILLGIYAEQG